MADRHGAIGAQQQLRDRPPHERGAAEHDGVLPRQGAQRIGQQHRTAERRARHGKVERRAGGDRAQPADVDRVKAIDVLRRIDGKEDLRGVDVPGQRQLHQDTADRGIGVQPADQFQQLGLRGLRRQAMIEARHADLGGCLALAADVDLARGIGADQHRREAGPGHTLGDERRHALGHAAAQAGCERLAIDQLRFSHCPLSIRRSGTRARQVRPSRRKPCCARPRPA